MHVPSFQDGSQRITKPMIPELWRQPLIFPLDNTVINMDKQIYTSSIDFPSHYITFLLPWEYLGIGTQEGKNLCFITTVCTSSQVCKLSLCIAHHLARRVLNTISKSSILRSSSIVSSNVLRKTLTSEIPSYTGVLRNSVPIHQTILTFAHLL